MRPLATIALTTFNHAKFVRQAVQSALAQDYSPLEILISDDASQDDTVAIVQEMLRDYKGPHQVRVLVNERNLGVGAHTDRLGAMARGEMVFLAAGDDIDRPDRVSRIMDVYLASQGRVTAVSAASTQIDEEGREIGAMPQPLHDFSLRNVVLEGVPLIGPAAYSARVFKEFAPMGGTVVAGEDLVLALRAALVGEIVVLSTPVSFYRQHGASLMGQSNARSLSPKSYRRGLQRLLSGFAAARETQLRDYLDYGRRTPSSDDPELLQALRQRAQRDGMVARMAAGEWSALAGWVRFFLAARVSAREFARTLVMTRMPGLWYRYLRSRTNPHAPTRSA